MTRNRLLDRQLRRATRADGTLDIDRLLEQVADAYEQEDSARRLNENAFMLMSEELTERNNRLSAYQRDLESTIAARTAALQSALAGAQAASRAKSEFLANLSHEVRTPLNGILGMAHLLRDSTLSDEQGDWLGVLERSGRSLLHLLNDLIDMARLEAGQLGLVENRFELADLVGEMVVAFADPVRDKRLALGIEATPERLPAIKADRARLRQILHHLLGNAVKFTDAGHVRLILSLRPTEDGKTLLGITIEDTGIGIPPAQMASLFEPFSQGDSSTSRRHGGTGMGLAICRRLVTAMGGRIAIEPREGGGTRAICILPVELAEPLDVAQRAPIDTSILKGAHLLVVEDTPVNRQLLKLMLERLGCRIELAGTGLEAIDMLHAASQRGDMFDAVLLDCQMPELDGMDTARLIRSAEMTSDRRMPLIAVTASILPSDHDLCYTAGMDAVVPKPIDPNLLKSTLVRHLSLRAG